MNIYLYTDGASRGNPGEAGIGVVILGENGSALDTYFEYIGTATNNVAEYKALVAGLKLTEKYIPCSVQVFMDSELIVNQMKGSYKVKAENLIEWHFKASQSAIKFDKINFEHIPRKKNITADKLANYAIDTKKIFK